ncbi:hypothetical protein PGTUg99_035049 [Puccinia graminis f. sp. tritici]|uniref:Uncharacterized protein n=1 Tax=Puccinia graminis f. sp. tritici TaxID=56615 RepID=A0A5B0N2L9_PUCGR|nr:hypothetical protein PGTUg99_035049 [Puccinia graminis f. sp. tritici]
MTWSGCKRLSAHGRGEAEGVTASQPITVQFLPGQEVAVQGYQSGMSGVFDFECYWSSPSDPNARTPFCGGCRSF